MSELNKYSFSFTGASALIAETLTAAEVYAVTHDIQLTKQKIKEGNLLNRKKDATFIREFQEISKRLLSLTPKQINILCLGDREEAKHMILLSILKNYLFLFDFIVEVVRNKILIFENTISELDYKKFLESKSMTHYELEKLSDTTKDKVKQRTFTILEQIGIINNVKEKYIIRPVLSRNCMKAIIEDDANYLSGFLLSPNEIKSFITTNTNGNTTTRHSSFIR